MTIAPPGYPARPRPGVWIGQPSVAGELRRAANLTIDPADLRFCRVYRWSEALPEFDPGYFHRLRDFGRQTTMDGRVVFAGDYAGGPFVAGAVGSGERAADQLARRLAGARSA